MKPKKQFLPSETASAIAGISSRTLRRWREEGKIEQNSEQKYDLIGVLLVAIEKAGKGENLQQAQAKLTTAQTQKTKVETQILEGKRDKLSDSLLDAEEVQKVWEGYQGRLKAKIKRLEETLPDKLQKELPSAIALSQQQKEKLLQSWRKELRKELDHIWE